MQTASPRDQPAVAAVAAVITTAMNSRPAAMLRSAESSSRVRAWAAHRRAGPGPRIGSASVAPHHDPGQGRPEPAISRPGSAARPALLHPSA